MDLMAFLDEHGISYERFDHPAVFTCEESEKLPPMPGFPTKNLFLRNEKGTQYFIVSVGHEKRVDLKELGKVLGAKLSFGNPEMLKKYLGVEPGSVTLFGVIHDTDHKVEVIVDRVAWESEKMQCHPLVNTTTLAITPAELARFFAAAQHGYQILEVPAKL